MSFTLSNCIERINQVLNYPSLTYTDVSAFFDQAIAELNTSLHIGLRSITECISYLQENNVISSKPNVVVFADEFEGTGLIKAYSSTPTDGVKGYYDTTQKLYGIRQSNGTYYMSDEMYAIYNTLTSEGIKIYKAIMYAAPSNESDGLIAWAVTTEDDPLSLDLLNYIPNDWIVLFLIPYVCFKYSVRDGDTGALYSEEFVQGFQQLQQAYNVPSFVSLTSHAHLPAYKKDVMDNLNKLDIIVPTRAITEAMRSPAIVHATYGDFYDSNGWRY